MPTDQGTDTDEEGDNNTDAEGGNAESAGGTDSTDPEPDAGAAIDGPDSMPMPQQPGLCDPHRNSDGRRDVDRDSNGYRRPAG